MRPTFSLTLSFAAALTIGAIALGQVKPATDIAAATTQPFQAVDLHNTVCPVSGDKVDDSKLAEVYDGKIYHLCCADCHNDFEKDPAKYAKAVSDNPAKYGVKQ